MNNEKSQLHEKKNNFYPLSKPGKETMKFLKNVFLYLINDSFVTFVIGFVLGMVYMTYGITDALIHLEKLVCK